MKETVKTFVILVLVLLVVLLSVTSMKCYQKSQDKPETVYLTDTITQVMYDTIFIDHFEIVKLPVVDSTVYYITDTVTRVDSVFVEVPISIYKLDTTFFTDSTSLNIHIQNSGYEVTLDTLYYRLEYTPTPIKLPKTNFFRDHFRFGVGVSSGYGFFSKQSDIFVGVGVYYVF